MTVSPPGDAPSGTIGRRVGAFAIDIALAYLVVAVIVGIVAGVTVALARALQPGELAAVMLFAWSGTILLLLGWWLVYSGMQGGHGSIGQRLLGLRLADAGSGEPIGFWRAVWRNIVFGLAGSIVVGYFTPLFDASARRQGWHDMASGAVVVDVRAARAAGSAASRRPAGAPAAAGMPRPARPAPPLPVLAPASPLLDRPATASPAWPSATASATPAWPSAAAAPAWPPAAADRPAAPPLSTAHQPTGPVADLSWLFRGEQGAPAEPTPRAEPVDAFPSVTMPFPAATTTEPFGAAVPRGLSPAVTTDVHPAPQPAVAASGTTVLAWEPADDDVDATRAAVPPPAQRAALYAEAPVIAVLTWDDGTRMAVYGRTLYGRNPASEQGAVAIAVRDETLSLSKTHFEIGGDAAGAWIVDRHSTNGTTLVRDGSRIPLVPGLPTSLRAGDSLELGDRRVTVGAGR
jgi:uncharacterized RDD family membrane protein YckC